MTGLRRVGLAGLRRRLRPGPAGRPGAWVERAPETVNHLAGVWDLIVGPPLAHDGDEAIVHRATRHDGSEAILKLTRPGIAVEREAEALTLVDGRGAVRLLECDTGRGAMLLERADDTTTLAGAADREDAIDAALGVLEQWWRPAPATTSIRTVRETNGDDHADLSRRAPWLVRRISARDVERALESLTDVPSESFLLHCDLHLGNVLGSGRGWLAIDPQPIIGPRVRDLEPLLRDASTTPPSLARSRLDRLVERIGVDREEATRCILGRGFVVGSWSIETGSADWGWRHIDAVLATVS